MESFIKGIIQAVYFESDTSFYKVLLVRIEETNCDYDDDTIVVTGSFHHVHEETSYTFYGQLIDHPRFGIQFQTNRYEQAIIASANGLIKYFSSDKFPGIGEVLAGRIVDTLGVEAIDKIIKQVPELLNITGLTKAKREMLVQVVSKDQGDNKTVLMLLQFGFTDREAFRIFQQYKETAITTVEENPYLLIETIEGIGFSKIDTISENRGIASDDVRRFRGAIFFALKELSFRLGHTYFDAEQILTLAIQLLEKQRKFLIDEMAIAAVLETMLLNQVIIEDHSRLALPMLYFAEMGIAKKISYMMDQDQRPFTTEEIDDVIQAVEKQFNMTYAPLQKEAIKKAIISPMSLLTGGPGTGKTTVLKGIVHAFALLYDIDLSKVTEYQSPILLAAPTGRAAKRMKELIGLPASTLHRLLGIGITGNEILQDDMSTNALDGLLLIVDEMSMVDTWLMNWLLKSIHLNIQVVFVGDHHQLPSVGPGQVLHDLIASRKIPMTQLETVFRQQNASTLIPLAHQVKNGNLPEDFTTVHADRSFIAVSDSQLPVVVQKVYEKALTKGYSKNDIQILAPMYRGNAGIDALNDRIQQLVNPNSPRKREVTVGINKVFRIGDKVLQLVNVAEKNVFNGDIGEIVAILNENESEQKAMEIIVNFDDNEVHYLRNEWTQLTLAYCCSVHKAQGSEFPVVILPMVRQYGRMLRRDLFYTALTRSKQSVVFCGDVEAFKHATIHQSEERLTLLCEKIIEKCKYLPTYAEIIETNATINLKHVKEEDTTYQLDAQQQHQPTPQTLNERVNASEALNWQLTMANWEQIDGMIGMAKITPFDFMKK